MALWHCGTLQRRDFGIQYLNGDGILSLTSTVFERRTMWIFPLVGYAGVLLGFGFLTLAIGDLQFLHNTVANAAIHTYLVPYLVLINHSSL